MMQHGSIRPGFVSSRLVVLGAFLIATFGLFGTVLASGNNPFQNSDLTGQIETFTMAPSGTIDTTNPFFQNLGANGRTCATCHIQASAWSIQTTDVVSRFNATQGLDPLFATVDGVDCPNADMSTLAHRTSNTTFIRTMAVFRIDLPIPANAEFFLSAVNDPCGFIQPGSNHLSLYRRPLPAANLNVLTGVMWDQRNTIQPVSTSNSAAQNLAAIQADVDQTTITATMTHAQGTQQPTGAQIAAIDAFEFANFTAQVNSSTASGLNQLNATGGAVPLQAQTMQSFVGQNDPFGNNPTGAQFNNQAMTIYTPWTSLTPSGSGDTVTIARLSVARGENIFNTRPINITGVAGLNDVLNQPLIVGTCTTCHDTPNIGNHSIPLMMNTGVSSHHNQGQPIYTLQNISNGQTTQTSDPGLAMITGKWADIGKFKVPVLRGLAARAPYFHNGETHSLTGVAIFYNVHFNIGLTTQDETDLANFLQTL
jgi:hypothetical protein